jgi:HEPN domain-containing protein
MTSQVNDWLAHAKLDLETIKEIIENPNLTSIVAFHAQQSIEKSLKAAILHFTSSIPRIHNIVSLIGTANNYCNIEIDRKIIFMLNQAYTDTRYPREIGQDELILPSQQSALIFQKAAEKLYEEIEQIITREIGT